MWLAILVSVAILSFLAGVAATLVYLVYVAKDVEETNEVFEATLRGDRK
jgi:hypothetical protein